MSLGEGSLIRTVQVILFLLGSAIFLFLWHEIGAGEVWQHIQTLGWTGMLVIVGLAILTHVANTCGWRLTFGEQRRMVSLRRLFGVRLAGEAINYLTPTALGGDVFKAILLKGTFPLTRGLATVTIAKLSQTLALGVFILGGVSIVGPFLTLSLRLRMGIALSLVGGASLLGIFFWLQRRGLFSGSLVLLDRLRIRGKLLGRMQEPARLLDQNIAAFYRHHHKRFWGSVGWFFLGWSVGVIEIYLILIFFHLPATLFTALAIEVFSTLLNAVLFFIPGKLGVQEGGKVLIFTLLGLDPVHGFSLGIVRRIRELIWVGIGLLILAVYRTEARPEETGIDGTPEGSPF
ncbi:MAG: TIGR00374 family protein [Nitrospinota bacterium]|nr:MAG: TIGR00374 family protein [Nitrospinota bacterium]